MLVLGLVSGSQQFLLGALARHGGPSRAAAVNAATAAVVLLPLLVAHEIRKRNRKAVDGLVALIIGAGGVIYLLGFPTGLAWYFLVPGLMGLVLVSGLAYVVPRIGTAAALTGVVGGQVVSSMVWDQLGLLGLHRVPIGPLRIVGGVILVLGVLLVLRREAA